MLIPVGGGDPSAVAGGPVGSLDAPGIEERAIDRPGGVIGEGAGVSEEDFVASDGGGVGAGGGEAKGGRVVDREVAVDEGASGGGVAGLDLESA